MKSISFNDLWNFIECSDHGMIDCAFSGISNSKDRRYLGVLTGYITVNGTRGLKIFSYDFIFFEFNNESIEIVDNRYFILHSSTLIIKLCFVSVNELNVSAITSKKIFGI